MVKTKLQKHYNSPDMILRIPDGSGVKVGMRMKITHVKRPNMSGKFTVHKLGSIILKEGLQHDYEPGSTIVQTHAMSGNSGDNDSAVNCTVVARRTRRGNTNPEDSDDDHKNDAASNAPSAGAVSDDWT